MIEYTKIHHSGVIYYIRKAWLPPEPRTSLDLLQNAEFVIQGQTIIKCRYGIEFAFDELCRIKE